MIKQYLAFILILFMVGCQNYPDEGDVAGWTDYGMSPESKGVYPVPEDGHKPFNLVLHEDLASVHEACGAERVSYGPMHKDRDGRMVRGKIGACSFADSSGCTIHMTEDGGRLHLKHEQAHCDGTYDHDGVTFGELWARISGNTKR